MIFLGVILGLVIMAGMVYMAIDKKSTPMTRVVSLIAIGVMVLTLIICLFIILTNDRVQIDESTLIVGEPAEVKKEGGANIWIFVMLIIILLGLFGVIAFNAFRENKKQKAKQSGSKLSIPSGNIDF